MDISKARSDIQGLPTQNKCQPFFQASGLIERGIYKISRQVLIPQSLWKKITPQKPLVKADKVNKTLTHPVDLACYTVSKRKSSYI